MAEIMENYRITAPGGLQQRLLIIGATGLALSALGYFVDAPQLFYSYLTAFTFWTSLALGALFFTMLHHLVDATWSIVLRRINETIMTTMPLLALLFLPIIAGMHDLYHWTHADAVANDPILQMKAPWLNTGFFLIRTAFYFAVWWFISQKLYGISLQQDVNGYDPHQTRRFRLISAPGMILFALTSTFAAFDWLMSLDPHWYSTIFGVYVFGGGFLGLICLLVLLVQYLRSRGLLVDTITIEHYHDLGKLMFAFTVFWAYIAFSQYFLIWYANIPEETIWYQHRWPGSWKIFTMLIVFGKFIVPFLLLMLRATKRSLPALRILAVWMLLMHWVDLHWIVLPNLHQHGAHLSWMDLTTMVGVGGLFLWWIWRRLALHELVPVNDPRLDQSIAFTND
jgi:hypothetical protein